MLGVLEVRMSGLYIPKRLLGTDRLQQTQRNRQVFSSTTGRSFTRTFQDS